MALPFSTEQFFDVFARYNAAVWPAQILLNLLAITCVAQMVRAQPSSDRVIAAILGVLWIWVAIAYHFWFFAAINPAARVFGVMSFAGGMAFLLVGVIGNRLRFLWPDGWRGWTGGALILYALILYPIIGLFVGHRYPHTPTFGLPCPLTIFTIGMLMFAVSPVPRSVFVVPVAWALIGSSAAFVLGVTQDLMLLVAAAVGVARMIAPRAPSPVPSAADH